MIREITFSPSDSITEPETVKIYDIKSFPFDLLPNYSVSRKNDRTYLNVIAAFDIETTTITPPLGSELPPYGFMYIWQMCIDKYVCMGRTWEEFQTFLDSVATHYNLTSERRLCIYVHNLSFEFQFIRNFLNIEDTSVFARAKRKVVRCDANNAFQFRCSYFLSNMSLAKFLKNTPNVKFQKQSGDDFDYKKLRLPITPLTDEELSYCYCDVRGLCEALSYYFKSDTMASIPMTSTGFLRREARIAVRENPDNISKVQECALTEEQYNLCKYAVRGGNTHANAIYSDILLRDLHSKDIKSSYPAVMVACKFPVTPFIITAPTHENLQTLIYNEHKACLLTITLYSVQLLNTATIPYIALGKCRKVRNTICDNGRVVTADYVSLTCTDIDYKIITSQYSFEEIEVTDLQYADYGYLNNELRNLIMEYFHKKETLNPKINPNADPYIYMKFKNRINAFFGMMLTDICPQPIVYDSSTIESWQKGENNIADQLQKHYRSRKTFLSYQHGVWVTANARQRLQEGLDVCGEDIVYCDTDSCKYLFDHNADFEALNEKWYEQCEESTIKPYTEVNGKRIYLGIWDDDGEYDYFKTLGAKKYCYIERNNPQLHITVAGLNKAKGAKFLESNGGIDSFKVGLTIPPDYSGRTTAYYNDHKESYQLTINNCTFTTGSNVGIVNTTYKLGISDDYLDYLLSINPNLTIQDLEENEL